MLVLMTELFQHSKKAISEHLSNIFAEGELEEQAVVRNFQTTAADGKTYQVVHYLLGAVLAVAQPDAIERDFAEALVRLEGKGKTQ